MAARADVPMPARPWLLLRTTRDPSPLSMTTHQSDAATILTRARAAQTAGALADALELYARFFMQTGIESSRTFQGVRLSYCLSEWAELGAKYPPALDRLTTMASEALRAFDETGDAKQLRDYAAIAIVLDKTDEAMALLAEYYAQGRIGLELAYASNWQALAKRGFMSMCNGLTPDAIAACRKIIQRHAAVLEFAQVSGKRRQELCDTAGWHLREDLGLLCDILRDANRLEELAVIETMSRCALTAIEVQR